MLDALVDEARDRWGLDLSAGLQVVAAERLDRTGGIVGAWSGGVDAVPHTR